MSVEKISVDYNKVTNVEVEDEYDTSTWEEIQTNDDQDLNTSTIAKIDDEIMVSLEIFTSSRFYSFCKERSIVNALTVGEEGILEVQTKIKNNTYGITLLPNSAELDYEKLVVNLPRMCSQIAKCSDHR